MNFRQQTMVSNLTEDEKPAMTLEQLNQQEFPRVITLIVYLSTISVAGAIGNILVIYIYLTQFKRSNAKYFILSLAYTDLFSSIISHPFEIKVVLNQFAFVSDPLCKVSRLFNFVPTLASGFLFFAIATDRYRKVCRPFGWQLSLRAAKYVCVGSFVCSAIFSWPTLVVYGLGSFPVPKLRENGTMCSINDSFKGTVYPLIYMSTLTFLFIFVSLFLVTMFTLIGRRLHSQSQKMAKFGHPIELKSENNKEPDHTTAESSFRCRSMTGDETCIEGQNMRGLTSEDLSKSQYTITDFLNKHGCTGEEDPDQGNESDSSDDLVVFDHKGVNQDGDSSRRSNDHTNAESKANTQSLPTKSRTYAVRLRNAGDQDISSYSPIKKQYSFRSISNLRTAISPTSNNRNEFNDVKKCRQYKSRKISRIDKKRTRRNSFLMFLISLAFILSYLPNAVLMMARDIKKDFVSVMSPGQRAAYLFFLHSYALNSAVNPFIYSAFDKRFRIAFRKTFRRFV